MKRNRMSLQDIATLAGLTKMTVSRYMRDPSKVSERSRCAIDEVMRQHNYIPNRLPEMLSGAGSKTLGVIIPSFRNQIFSDVLEGIQQVAEKHGYQTIIASDNYDPLTGQEKIITLLSYHIDGLLLTGTQHTQTARDYLKTSGIPVAELMEITSDPLDIQVGFDNRQAAFDMTGEFIRRGKKQMAFIGAMDDPRDVSRYQGMTQALQEYGLSGHHYVPGAISSMVLGRRLFQQIIAQHPQTDAIFCTNDDLAMGVLLECQARRIRVPEDIAIAGFHGLDIGSANQQKLASVITPRLEAGQVATGLLIAQLEGRRTAGSETVDLGYRLFTGDTL
ncbi:MULTISPECIES: LacI family DNA-binding transcriptional regulator [Tatumella]|uniref:LacI family DNA-binding transcriptional regulator n=1 Tax=Tatumella TaxID=82986 RepID=UPI0004729EF2|nr:MULTISPECIES: LacI family DNA-binding transcriptional regulator [Tatumella]